MKYDENWALERAVEAAKNSKCQSKRGVVIWSRYTGIITSGWNAPPAPFKCNGSDECKATCSKTAVHAEQAALMALIDDMFESDNLEMLHVKIINNEAVISEKPSCWQCSKLILASGIHSMWLYQKEGLVRYTPEEFHKQTLDNCDLKYIL